ncbi:hypothetical protein QWY90_10795 [Flavobacterium paronense]|uniref:Lipoprotein n=1 Tax=Flavobacterium paronense TaxID=1392775 RepID=A0ABV5GC45_9FLAO|nr:hypothetical protein [Flavobacterium paronense]MDN3677797.1 hypothetical protein [Flavobacterium paronense]
MKRIISILLATALVCTSCQGQEHKKEKKEKVTSQSANEKPKVEIKVNKKYDKQGNLIAYDSTYTSFYANRKGDKVLMDSLFREFKPIFNKQFPLMKDENFNQLFYSDTLLYNDFFHDDFFRKRMELNQEYMRKMMQQMDSIKNAYFKKQGKELKQKK